MPMRGRRELVRGAVEAGGITGIGRGIFVSKVYARGRGMLRRGGRGRRGRRVPDCGKGGQVALRRGVPRGEWGRVQDGWECCASGGEGDEGGRRGPGGDGRRNCFRNVAWRVWASAQHDRNARAPGCGAGCGQVLQREAWCGTARCAGGERGSGRDLWRGAAVRRCPATVLYPD
ncbi:hypothetical protein BN2476_1670001 [Paraburkholderia piptadeniae]|uniref:Uncharacterized protein n=1 Tax=Paraburkholderia piptadeniae TaxID=1701573 RepID=A0A1N7SXD8_9BURK|nr:hypothetical protein BN2476_1670001 [Paraburkholderia piptadeniae]